MVDYTQKDTMVNVLTPEGSSVLQLGSYEAQFWGALSLVGEGEGKTLKQVQVSLPPPPPPRAELALSLGKPDSEH